MTLRDLVWRLFWVTMVTAETFSNHSAEPSRTVWRPCTGQSRARNFREATRRRWGCDTILQRAACEGARYFFRERARRRAACASSKGPHTGASGRASSGFASALDIWSDASNTEKEGAEHVKYGQPRNKGIQGVPGRCDVISIESEVGADRSYSDDSEKRQKERVAKAGARDAPRAKSVAPDAVPRDVHDLLKSIIRVVKTGDTRLAVYLRGWDTLRPYSEGTVRDPPTIKTCILAVKIIAEPKRFRHQILGCFHVCRCRRWVSRSRIDT